MGPDWLDLDSSFVKVILDSQKLESLSKGARISEPISARGFTCQILVRVTTTSRIDDHSSNKDEYISLGVRAREKSRNVVKAILHAFVMKRDGSLSSGLENSTSCGIISNSGDPTSHGARTYKKVMKRSELESDDYIVDGCVTFLCGVTVLLDNRLSISVPASDLGNHLGDLLDRKDGSDLAFSVAGETFRAHRAVLAARSPVFKVQLFSSMADAKMDRVITLHDIKPATSQLLLRYMYTDALPPEEELDSSSSVELLQHLLVAADMYHIDRLKAMCAQKLSDRVTVDNVATMLCCAETAVCPELKNVCMDFFMAEQNFKKAVVTEGYFRLMQSCPSVIDEIRARVRT